MQTISHPMRLDSAGAVITIDDSSPRAAAELAGHVLACLRGERPLAPDYGVADSAGTGLSESSVAGALAVCEPELSPVAILLTQSTATSIRVQVDVEWSQS